MRKLRDWKSLRKMIGSMLLALLLIVAGVFVFLPLGANNFDIMSWIGGQEFIYFVFSAIIILVAYVLLTGKAKFNPNAVSNPSGSSIPPTPRNNPQRPRNVFRPPNTRSYVEKRDPFSPRRPTYNQTEYTRDPDSHVEQPLISCELCGKKRPEDEMATVVSSKGDFFICEDHIKPGRFKIDASQ